jgi:uncharacterized membrane protein YkvA (DUF1232 family)
MKRWARVMKRDVIALWLAARDPRVPYLAKVLAAVVAAYALSPIDLIPDFIPLVGYLDDLLLVPLGIWVAVRLVPPAVMAELRDRAAREPIFSSRLGLVIVVMIWLAALAAAAWLTWPPWRAFGPGNTNPG